MSRVPEALRRPIPWRVGDVLLLYTTTVAGCVLVLASWFGVAGEVRVDDQIVWMNTGVAGVIVLGAGNLAWLLTGRKATGALRRALLPTVPVTTPTETLEPASVDDGRLVAAKGMTRYHRPDCILVLGKAVRAHSLAAHQKRGLQPCDVCAPADAEAAG